MIFLFFFSFIGSVVPSDLLLAQKELYEAFETSSIDSVLKIPDSRTHSILDGAAEENPFKVFVLGLDNKKADSLASNNFFIHFYFYILAEDDSVKEEEMQWMSDIIASKGLVGSKHASAYFYSKALQSADDGEKLIFLNLSREMKDDPAVSREIISMYWNKKLFSKTFTEIIRYIPLLKKPFNALESSQTPLYVAAIFFLVFGFYVLICAFFKNAIYIWHSIYHLSKKFLKLDLSSKFSSSLIMSSFFILVGKPFFLGALIYGLALPLLGKKEKFSLTTAGIGVLLLSMIAVEFSAALRAYTTLSPQRSVFENILYLEGGGNPDPDDEASDAEIFASALLCRRDKDFKSALALYSRIESSLSKHVLFNNRGCLFFDIGMRDSAFYYFQTAWRNDSMSPEINYNLYIYHLKTFQKEKSAYFKTKLENASPGFLEEKSFGMLSLLPTSEFLTLDIVPHNLLKPAGILSHGSIYDERFSFFFGYSLKKTLLIMVFFAGLGFFLNFALFRKISVEICSICGAPVCNLCKRSQKGTLLCSVCLSRVEKLGKLADEKGIINEISESLSKRRKRFYFAYSMLLPGFVHNIRGKGFRFDFAAVTSVIVTLFVFYSMRMGEKSLTSYAAFFIVFAAVYMLFGLFSYFASRE